MLISKLIVYYDIIDVGNPYMLHADPPIYQRRGRKGSRRSFWLVEGRGWGYAGVS